MKITYYSGDMPVVQLCDLYFSNLPMRYPPVLNPIELLKNVTLNAAQGKELYTCGDHFLRYDLTRPQFNMPARSTRSFGPVFRKQCTHKYRWREFYTYDCDTVFATHGLTMFYTLLNLLSNFNTSIVIKVNCLNLLKSHLDLNLNQQISEKIEMAPDFDRLKYSADFFKKYNFSPQFKNVTIEVDPCLTRGHDYYEDFIFEVYAKNCAHAIAGGGTYVRPDCIKMFGFGIGVSRISAYGLFTPALKPAIGILFKQDAPSEKITETLTALACRNVKYGFQKNVKNVKKESIKLEKKMAQQFKLKKFTLIVGPQPQYTYKTKEGACITGSINKICDFLAHGLVR